MGLWSKKEEPPRTHTNAPRHWPAVQLDQFDVPAMNLIAVAGQLAKVHAPPQSTMALMREFVYEDGILEVPIVVEEDGHKTAVFVYSNKDDNAAAHYSGVRALLKSRENAAAVYYGPATLNPTKAVEVLKPIDTPMFAKLSTPPENASYALWWATAEDPLFSNSPDRALLDRWFEALDGYGFLVLTAFVKDLELVEAKEKKLYALPDQPLLEPLKGPGEADVLLHASAPEGIFLAFERTKTPVRTRRVLLTLLANFATQYRAAIDRQGIPARADERGLAMWKQIRDQALAKEAEGSADLVLHGVEIRDGQPARSPSAQSAAERASRPKVPEHEELDFAMDLIERVVARLKRRPVEQSSQEALAQPNVFPVIAVRANGHVWERHLPYENELEARAAAGRILDEWPDAEIVAVLSDAAIRENGVRTDVLGVTMENRFGVAGDLIQRYRTSASGEFELVARPTASPAAAFLQTPAAPRSNGAVDPGLAALGAQAVDEIISDIGRGDATQMLRDHPDDPLIPPSAITGKSDAGPILRRFMAQGPITAAMTCIEALSREPADWVVFFIDDVVTKDGEPDRRLRLCVQRRGDAGAAIFDQHYGVQPGGAVALRGDLEFRRYGGSFFD